jgi:hypothetical protein
MNADFWDVHGMASCHLKSLHSVTTGHTSFQVLSLLACFDVVDYTLLPSNGQPAKTLVSSADAEGDTEKFQAELTLSTLFTRNGGNELLRFEILQRNPSLMRPMTPIWRRRYHPFLCVFFSC